MSRTWSFLELPKRRPLALFVDLLDNPVILARPRIGQRASPSLDRVSSPAWSTRCVLSCPARTRSPAAASRSKLAAHWPGQPTTAITPSLEGISTLKDGSTESAGGFHGGGVGSKMGHGLTLPSGLLSDGAEPIC
jgi:hypothetical protein